jgi:tRNA/tmRNA/rRNA uracil-C5-methylase (TrmA/RlmC/RlmD family)
MTEPREFTLRIDKLVPNGFGIGFADGKTVFVSLAAKGDLVRVREWEKRKNIVFAEIVEILEPSPDRVEPRCEHVGVCGGCNFQHLSYAAQLSAKTAIIEDCLRRIGRFDLDVPVEMIGSPDPFGYRGRVEWHLDPERRSFGYFKRGSHDMVDVERCPVLVDELQSALTQFRGTVDWDLLMDSAPSIEAAAASGKVSIFTDEILAPTEEISFSAAGETYFYDARTFFQGNPSLIGELIETAVGGAEGECALDLFCGVGLFTLPLARRFKRVIAVESNERSVGYLKKNAKHAGLGNIEIDEATVSQWMADCDGECRADFVLLDPPRSGGDKLALERIVEFTPATVSYVSCEPATLARDLRFLCDAGYNIRSITALDLFPQTHHVETVVRLTVSN